MTAKFIIKDDMSGEDLTDKEHFEVRFDTISGEWSPPHHFELWDQVSTFLMDRSSEIERVNIIRKNDD